MFFHRHDISRNFKKDNINNDMYVCLRKIKILRQYLIANIMAVSPTDLSRLYTAMLIRNANPVYGNRNVRELNVGVTIIP